ncbi:hypothetical protein ACFWE3_16625 [Mycobacteriaceae bacterium NPDC060252]
MTDPQNPEIPHPGYPPYQGLPYPPPPQYAPIPAQYQPPYGAAGYPYPPPAVNIAMYGPAIPRKSSGVAILLSFLFGPLGMLYSTVSGGLIMLGVNFMIFILGFLSAGLAWILWFFTWIGGMIWAYTAAEEHNRRITPPYR